VKGDGEHLEQDEDEAETSKRDETTQREAVGLAAGLAGGTSRVLAQSLGRLRRGHQWETPARGRIMGHKIIRSVAL
jgi:hypothetical protein